MLIRPDTLAMTAVLAMLTALGPLSTDMYLPSLPTIARALDTTTAGTQLTLSIFLIGFAAGQFFYGPISDRVGRKPALLAGMAIFLLGSGACAIAPGIELLVAGRFAQAVGAAGPVVIGRAMVRDLYEGSRAGRELSRMGTIMGVVPAVAPVIGGVLHELFGWRASFFATVVFGLALVTVIGVLTPETLRQRAKGPLSFLGILRSFGPLLKHRGYRIYVTLAALTYSGLFAFISGSSFVLQDIYGVSAIAFGVSFMSVVMGYIAGTILAQRLVGRRGLDGTIAIGVTCLAVGGSAMLGLVAAGLWWPIAIVVPMAAYTAGVGLTLPQTLAAAMMPFPDRAGAASSLLGITQMSLAALVGIGVGHALGGSALPLPCAIAATGLGAFALFRLSAAARRG